MLIFHILCNDKLFAWNFFLYTNSNTINKQKQKKKKRLKLNIFNYNKNTQSTIAFSEPYTFLSSCNAYCTHKQNKIKKDFINLYKNFINIKRKQMKFKSFENNFKNTFYILRRGC